MLRPQGAGARDRQVPVAPGAASEGRMIEPMVWPLPGACPGLRHDRVGAKTAAASGRLRQRAASTGDRRQPCSV